MLGLYLRAANMMNGPNVYCTIGNLQNALVPMRHAGIVGHYRWSRMRNGLACRAYDGAVEESLLT